MLRGLFFIMLAGICVAAHAAPVGQPTHLGEITVSGTPLPVPGLGVPLSKVPANVQTLNASDIADDPAANLPMLLERNLGSVRITNGQNNPFQPTVSFRGFDASPLLGTPEALSVYLDGVRVNEPFGDVVNFDLIPVMAIANVTLVPGSDPVYGLNTLGGALSFETRSGFDYPGLGAKAYAGSFGTESAALEYGAHGRYFGFYVAADHYDSDGWAAHNPSRVNQLFAKASFRGAATSVDASFTGADNRLEGNQSLPLSFLDDPNEAYTFPDYFNNRLAFAVVNVRHSFDEDLALAGNVYNRVFDTGGLDSDVNDDFDPAQPIGPDNSPSFNDFNSSHEHGYGVTLQLIDSTSLAGHDNRFVIGASATAGDTRFAQDQQPAVFSARRESVGFATVAPRTRLNARNRYYGLYFSNTFTFAPAWALTLSGRYNHAHVRLDDRLGDALNDEHDFSRFNPAVGLTWNPAPALTTWVSYDEGARAPTPSELTCADPVAPCSLPNSFLTDPPLEQVIARTWELGARGRFNGTLRWNAALYRTDLDDDLLFISVTGLKGFYRNVPGDRRQGFELGLTGTAGAFSFGVHYSFTDATYLSAFTEASPANSSAGPSNLVTVMAGDRMPGIPRHSVKLSVAWAATERFSVGAALLAQSEQYARGDENNSDAHGPVPGYAIVNLNAHYRPAPAWDIFLSVDNLFDRRYASFGQLGENVFANADKIFDAAHPVATQFRAMAAPRAIRAGFSYGIGAD